MAAEIYNLLYQLGVTANYTGFFYTAYAVSLCAEQPDRLLLVTKWLYPEVARQYKTTWKAVERNIRSVGVIIWQENRPLLEHLAHRNLDKKPRTTQMLAILASSLNSSRLAAQELDEPAAVQEDDPLPQLQAGSGGPSSVPIA
ncbi:sporulation initiation factor Spo0A C-terminal domain-containing protein [Flintibacter muris]|uniref:sporulation initiation factor Spo0A C-terminal domain-containing protein n=1 Tax=Flintibacter muris TaxID=2941327 RepID=UPI00203B0398|nr:sporulation initiation factor Spo0A C-terminal domain-containing protein [Flintibacter muris]